MPGMTSSSVALRGLKRLICTGSILPNYRFWRHIRPFIPKGMAQELTPGFIMQSCAEIGMLLISPYVEYAVKYSVRGGYFKKAGSSGCGSLVYAVFVACLILVGRIKWLFRFSLFISVCLSSL